MMRRSRLVVTADTHWPGHDPEWVPITREAINRSVASAISATAWSKAA